MTVLRWLREFLKNNSADGNIIVIVCFTGLLRSVIALATDWSTWSEDSSLQYRNSIFGLLFAIILILELRRMDKAWIRILFGFTFASIMSLHFLITNALETFGTFTALASIILMIVVYRGFWMFLVPSVYFTMIVTILIYPQFFDFLHIQKEEVISPSRWDINFWIGGLSVSFLIYYLKKSFSQRNKVLFGIAKELEKSNRKLEEQNQEFEKSRIELEAINTKLNSRVEERTRELYSRNVAATEYIKLNTKEIRNPLEDTITKVQELQTENISDPEGKNLMSLIKSSSTELKEVYRQINLHLSNQKKISRDDLR